MAQILTYAAGVERQGKDGMTGRERQAKAIMNLAQTFSREMHGNAMNAIAKSQQDAAMDVVQNTIDPQRQENDAAYAATLLRNGLSNTHAEMLAALKDPASEFSNMDPKDFREMLNKQNQEFYDGIKDSKHQETQAAVFTNYTMKNMPGVVASQAKMYKDNMKVKQGDAATAALSTLPPGDGEAFNLNTDYLISEMLPSDRFTSGERRAIGLGAALSAAMRGDRRLLDHMRQTYDVEALNPMETQRAENAYSAALKKSEDAAWAEGYKTRELQAENGVYQTWDSDIADPEIVARYGEGTINRWGKNSRTKLTQQLNYSEGMDKFMAGTPLTGLDDKTQQLIFHDAKRNMLEKAAAGGPDAMIAAMTDYAFFMSKQGVIDKELKANMGAMLNRPTMTKEAWADPNFQEAAVVFQSLNKILTPSQMMAQVGDEAYSNGMLVEKFLNAAGGDGEKAADAYIIHMNRLKDMPELKTKKPHREDTAAAVQLVLSGDLEKHDPAMDRWGGLRSAAGDAIHTGQIAYEIEKQYGIEIIRGLDHDAALTLATNKVASLFKYFGNEMIFTNGTDLNEPLNMPPGSSADDREKAWEAFAKHLGVKPGTARFQMVGQYGYITDETGEPIEEMGLFPLAMIGNIYDNQVRKAQSEEEGRNLEDNINNIAKHNRTFETAWNAKSGFDDTVKILADGTTLGNYKNSDESGRLMIRKQYDEEQAGWVRKMAQKFTGFVNDIQSGKYKGEANERFRTIANDEMLARLDSKSPSDQAIANMREVDRRSGRLQAEDAGRIDGPLTEENLEPSLKETDVVVEGDRAITDVKAWKKDAPDGATALREAPIVKPQNLSPLEEALWEDEGAVGIPYTDSAKEKNLTIGVGHKIEKGDLDAEEIRKYGKNRDWKKNPMTPSEAIWQLRKDIKEKTKLVSAFYGKKYASLSDAAKTVAVSMFFQLKNPKAFKGVRANLLAGNNKDAVAHMVFTNGPRGGKTSDWWKQTPNRIRAHAQRLGVDADAVLNELSKKG